MPKKSDATAEASSMTPDANAQTSPSASIDARIADLGDWRGELLARIRALIRGADAGVVEEWKWNTPVWSCDGIVCTGESYRKAVKLTFPRGAALADPAALFNASLEGKVRRAIDFPEGAVIDEEALTVLFRRAIAANRATGGGKRKTAA